MSRHRILHSPATCRLASNRKAASMTDTRIPCWHCDGSGSVEVAASKWSIDPTTSDRCNTCHGTGKIEPEDCATCGNTGWAQMADPEDEPLNYREPCGCDWTDYKGPARPPREPSPERSQEHDIIF